MSSLSSGSLSSTTTCTLYADLKKSVFAYAREGHITDDNELVEDAENDDGDGGEEEEEEDDDSSWATNGRESLVGLWVERESWGGGALG